MTERRIDLDIGMARSMPDLGQSGAGASRRDASEADRDAFEQALARDGGTRAPAPSPDGAPPPFALFPGAVPAAPVGVEAPAGLSQLLAGAADRVLVGDGGSGRREVRLDLKAEVLPGVTLSVYEDEGRLVAAFACASETSRETLCRCAQSLADELARSLSRPVLVRVSTDDPEDPCLYEAASAA